MRTLSLLALCGALGHAAAQFDPDEVDRKAPYPAVGTHHTLVILLSFTGQGTTDRARAEEALRHTDRYYDFCSNGQFFWEWDVQEVELPAIEPGTCEDRPWAAAARDIVSRRGVDMSRFQHTLTIIPEPAKCPWGGTANTGMWKNENGAFAWVAPHHQYKWQTYVHELAHNLGVLHADFGNNQYGDATDVMGAGQACMNAARQYYMGWTPRENVQEVSTSGYYTLTDLHVDAAAATHPQMLKIRYGGSWLFVAYRQRDEAVPYTQMKLLLAPGSSIKSGPHDDNAIHLHTQRQYHSSSSVVATVTEGTKYVEEGFELVNGELQYHDAMIVAHISRDPASHTAVVYVQLHCKDYPRSPCPAQESCKDKASYCGPAWESFCYLDSITADCPKLCGACPEVTFPPTPTPVGGSTPPPVVTPQPSTATPQPTTATPQPTTATPQPTTATPQPTTATPQPTTATPQPTTATPQPTTATPQPTTATPPPVTAAPVPKCEDTATWCASWSDYCTHESIRSSCVKTCGACPGEVVDADYTLTEHAGQVVAARVGTIADGYITYPSSLSASMTVVGTNCQVRFTELDVESHSTCRYDSVKITVGERTVGKYCGSTLPEVLQLEGEAFTVSMQSDRSEQASGFVLAFECEI
eukprot:TRINITY_DN6_c0_g1_i5.p1 TRINITY_DN6_c0_g1~~TRINITY_DN6_c0_g1_i5.p1  ORF type:complete len:641 (+),score=232.66 TRINITY_DN6_c0_g1_i5:57-1979(+)